MKKRGIFICIEGIDGCGKTTQAKLLVERLVDMGYDAIYTAEPSKGKIGQFIKEYCLHGANRVSSIIEALLFAADRVEHLENEVIPALNEGKLVVSDRYLYSSLAYQGAAGLDLEWIKAVNVHAKLPDLALFIDIKPKIAMQRLKSKKSTMETLENLHKVREVYVKFVEIEELMRIDGSKSIEEVADSVLKKTVKALEGF